MRTIVLLALVAAGGCYHGAPTSRDINTAWRGRARAEIQGRWGRPLAVGQEGGATVLQWSHFHRHFTLPSASGYADIGPGHADVHFEAHPGETWTTHTDVIAKLDGADRIVEVRGPSVRWGAPQDANLHWGTIFGLHAGMGRLDNTGTPLPSGGLYLGGMLGPHVGLVGQYALAFGKGNGGGAMGMAWGMGVAWFPIDRLSVRAGPAMVLALDPGFSNARLRPGVDATAAIAAVRSGTFVLDLRVELVAATDAAFGSVGIGVNRY